MTADSNLRYLDANHVEAPLAEFGAADILDYQGEKIGSIDGVLVDPGQRKAVYLVIRRGRVKARRELLPIADLRVEPSGRALRLQSETAPLEKFDARRYPAFSDDDLITAMFANRAA